MAAARLHNLWAWDDEALGLDFLQVHLYPDNHHPNATATSLVLRDSVARRVEADRPRRVPGRRASAASTGGIAAAQPRWTSTSNSRSPRDTLEHGRGVSAVPTTTGGSLRSRFERSRADTRKW